MCCAWDRYETCADHMADLGVRGGFVVGGIYCLKECFQKLSSIGLVWLGLKSIVGLYEWDKERFEFHQRQQIPEQSSEY
jgi:hypothetical protein